MRGLVVVSWNGGNGNSPNEFSLQVFNQDTGTQPFRIVEPTDAANDGKEKNRPGNYPAWPDVSDRSRP